ncbi:sporulation membrane protein YtaF [Kroppenstedtia eburnea]|uniref:Putative sporulation protein YtaF n=1 Tax=Kroppenstedtia eburnea TaxID=714067 RepID=A0A1N7LZ74_9BACL|nr:sporulation membrane protein YtaF [Kroppenstedtia eburnea]QKI81732.1 sporulation membrane protein YtaF [Kroppenstedtia eburnea]SIS79150.1 putative sporulation protein YtaF [Kroppenstedtia eburnea]
MAWLLILGFALSSSIDNLGVGMSYGLRKIRIGILSNLFIAVICFLFSMGGILSGQWIANLLPGILPTLLATFVLFFIGIRIILLTRPRKNEGENSREGKEETGRIEGILKHPERADRDRSGEIGLGEAALLGMALSANALTNGLSAGLIGLSPVVISLTAAIGSFLTLWLGVAIGRKVTEIRIGSFTIGQFSTVLSGVIIILIAINALLEM